MKPRDRKLLASVGAARRPIAVTVVLGLVVAGLTIAQAALLAHVIASAAGGAFALTSSLVWLAVVLVARAASSGAFELVGRVGAARVLGELRERLATHVIAARPGAAREERAGELATVAVGGVDALEAYFARYLPQLVLAAIVPVLVLGWLIPADPLPALLLAGTLPLVPVFMILVGKTTVEHTERRFRTLSLLGAHFLDVVRGLPTLRAFGREDAQADTMAAVGDRLRVQTLETLKVAFLSALVLELLAMLGTAIAAVTIGIQLVHGAITLQAGLTVLILAPELFLPLREVGAQYHASADGLEAAERLQSLTQDTPESPGIREVTGSSLSVEGVGFSHPGRGELLRNLTTTFGPAPELVAIVGPSGAGKTTLARLLLGFLTPDSGTISCGDVEVRDADPRAWRSRFVWVPQRPTLFAGTVRSNVLLVGGTFPDLDWLPDLDPDERIGEGGRALSAGETHRVALARAFAADRPFVVLDEPTAHLDEALAAEVGASLAELAESRVVVVCTHDEALTARADRVLRVGLRQAVAA